MPKILRAGLPPALLAHLLLRIRERTIAPDQLIQFSQWLDTCPTVPSSRWYKRFSGMIVCGEDELVKTFLTPTQAPIGIEVI